MARRAEDGGARTSPARYPVGSVAKAAEILLLLRDHDQLRLSDVAERLDVAVSTAHRLLTTLEAVGLVSQDELTRCYGPGHRLCDLAQALVPSGSRWEFARPYLAALSTRVRETVSLLVREGDEVAFVESIEAPTMVKVGSRLGALMPAHCISGGKVLLAGLTDQHLLELYRTESLPVLTPRSISNRTALLAEIATVRRRGYATNFGESEPDVSGVAVAVTHGPDGTPCAVAVAAPTSRLAQSRVRLLVAELHKTADLLGAAISG